MNKNKCFLLDNDQNYQTSLQFPIKLIISKFIIVIQYYVFYSIENMSNINEYIFNSGIFMSVNVFRLLLYYTKNLELTLYHTQNAIYYYVEYISQITDAEHNLFFNLSIKDAITYVYSRTIFNVNKSFVKKLNKKDTNSFKFISNNYNEYVTIISYIGMYILQNPHEDFKSLLQEISNIYIELFDKKINYNNILLSMNNIDNERIKNLNDITHLFRNERDKLIN